MPRRPFTSPPGLVTWTLWNGQTWTVEKLTLAPDGRELKAVIRRIDWLHPRHKPGRRRLDISAFVWHRKRLRGLRSAGQSIAWAKANAPGLMDLLEPWLKAQCRLVQKAITAQKKAAAEAAALTSSAAPP